jgi:hypothetical protein
MQQDTAPVVTSQRILRYEVPVDGLWHEIPLTHDPLAVAARDLNAVEFWAVQNMPPVIVRNRQFMVVGTGDVMPTEWHRHWGTAVTPGGSYVWHLLERVAR